MPFRVRESPAREDWEDALGALELGQPDSDSIVLTPADWEIICSIMSDDEVAARLQADGPDRPKSVVINGREWTDEGFAEEAT